MSMETLFQKTVSNWKDWGAVYQSIPAFSPLAAEIYRREGLAFSPLQSLTSGTNAVFRSGNTVVKIFFPKESGLDPAPDFHNEAAVCGRLTETGIPTPRLLAQGCIRDKYDFYYLITEYAEGREAGDWLLEASPEQKRSFVRRLKNVLCKLNCPASGLIPSIDLLKRAVENPRLSELPDSLAKDLQDRVKILDLSQTVLVHGDLTGENLLVTHKGDVLVIDCADACLAPAWYELGPIAIELFRCDPFLLREFAGDNPEEFIERLLDSISLHDFGSSLLQSAAQKTGTAPFSGLHEVKTLFERLLRADISQ